MTNTINIKNNYFNNNLMINNKIKMISNRSKIKRLKILNVKKNTNNYYKKRLNPFLTKDSYR